MEQSTRVPLADQFAKKIGFGHVVFESFAAIDENDWNFVGELARGVARRHRRQFLAS